MRSICIEGESYKASTAQEPVIAADRRATKVVLHFHLLEALSITEDGVKGSIRKLVTIWIKGPMRNHAREEGMGNPNLRRRNQEARELVVEPIWSAVVSLLEKLMFGINLEETVSYSIVYGEDVLEWSGVVKV